MDYIVRAYKDWKLHSQFTEIVQDMDEDYMFNEKQSIRESARSLKKYGSTCNHMRNNDTLVKHDIEKTDTLQGIALKYGCTTEQIRRANRLFASDSLFLRQYLLIPVDKSSPYYPKDDRPHQQQLPTRPYSIAGSEMLASNTEQSSPQQNHTSKNGSKSMDSVTMSPEEENRKCIDEFLGKIDSTIAESKKYVEKSQCNRTDLLTSQSDDDLFTTGGIRRTRNPNSSTYKHHYQQNSQTSHTRHSSSGSTSDTAQLLNITQGRRVQNSLQRIEKQQDEFFEL